MVRQTSGEETGPLGLSDICKYLFFSDLLLPIRVRFQPQQPKFWSGCEKRMSLVVYTLMRVSDRVRRPESERE